MSSKRGPSHRDISYWQVRNWYDDIGIFIFFFIYFLKWLWNLDAVWDSIIDKKFYTGFTLVLHRFYTVLHYTFIFHWHGFIWNDRVKDDDYKDYRITLFLAVGNHFRISQKFKKIFPATKAPNGNRLGALKWELLRKRAGISLALLDPAMPLNVRTTRFAWDT